MALAPIIILSLVGASAAQSGCFQLSGSQSCPQFASQYVNPSSLTSLYPFLASVTNVTSFDEALLDYLNTSFKTVKYNEQLGCTNTSSAYTIQYAQTFLCGEITTRSYQAGCTNVPYQRMTCQLTCLQYAVSENLLIANPTACGTVNTVGAYRQGNLTYDFTTCTDWATLISNNTATCALGQNNEPNCGFGASMGQLCNYCNPSLANGQLVDSCCIGSNVNLGSCGYTLALSQVAASPTPSSVSSTTAAMTATSSTSTGAAGATADAGSGTAGSGNGNSGSGNGDSGSGANSGAGSGSSNAGTSTTNGGSSGLSHGAIAGIVIGAVVGGLLLLALLLFIAARRKRTQSQGRKGIQSGLLAGAAGTSGYDQEKGTSSQEALAAKQKKLEMDTPPSPLSSGTLGFSTGRDSEDSRAMLGSAKSSPSITTAAAGALASYGLGSGAIATSSARNEGERPVSQDTSGTGSSNERNLVPSARDQYSSAEIVPGSEVVAIYAYEPNLPDELKLQPDSVVTVKRIYDDGWAIGTQNTPDGVAEGAFPLVVCTVVGAESDRDSSNSSHMVTASEAGGAQSSKTPARVAGAASSRRTSSIGDTSFESAPSHAPTTSTQTNQRPGIFGSLFRRSTSQAQGTTQ